jgi:hypothetical protein
MSAMTFGTFHRRCAPGELAIILSHFEEVKSEIHLLIYQRQKIRPKNFWVLLKSILLGRLALSSPNLG